LKLKIVQWTAFLPRYVMMHIRFSTLDVNTSSNLSTLHHG
jgi:hypothetical protein